MLADTARRHGIFYGWIITACAFLLVIVSVGLGVNCWGIFTIPVCDSLDISRQTFSSFITAVMLGQMCGSLTMTKMISRFGERGSMRIAAVVLPLAMASLSIVQNVFHFISTGFVIGYFIPPIGFLMLSMIISNWFCSLRGTAIGLAFMGSGMGSMILSPVINSGIETFGWRITVFLMGTFSAVIAVPICYFLIIERPEDAGLYPDGAKSQPISASADETTWGFTRAEVLRTPSFWLFVSFVLGIAMTLLGSSTTVPRLRDIGYSSAAAAAVYSASMGAIAVFRFFGGRVCDKLGLYRASLMFGALLPSLPLGLIFADRISIEAILISLGMGCGNVISGIGYSMLTGKLFGRKYFSQVYGVVSAVNAFAGAISPMICGTIYTRFGSYLPAYYLILTIFITGYIFFCISIKLQNKWKAENGIPLD